jgi:hypothetical protein
MTIFRPRIHVLLAPQAPVGFVIRRGPSRRVGTILRDRSRVEFRVGHWLKRRSYERRIDLPPDGEHLIDFAVNGRWRREARGAWTAISRGPCLKAGALFPEGDGGHGGGLFTGRAGSWRNDGHGHSVLRDAGAVRRGATSEPPGCLGGVCPGVSDPRRLRDGWRLVQRESLAR